MPQRCSEPFAPGFAPVLALLTVAAGCGPGDLEGAYWDIEIAGSENTCTDAPADDKGKVTYRVVYDGNDVQVAIGPDVFATGKADGCNLSYESVTWTEIRDGFEVSWQIFGVARAQKGGSACSADVDWEGTETFEIIASEDPSLSPGCTYVDALTGKFVEEVE